MKSLYGTKGLYSLVACLVLVWASLMTVQYQFSKSPLLEPSPSQLGDLATAKRIICAADSITCNRISHHRLEYRIKDLPGYTDILRETSWAALSLSAATYKTDRGYRIVLSRHLFDDISAVSMFLYHELQHVISSDPRFFKGDYGDNNLAACRDHNAVKRKTREFSEILDGWFKTPKGQNYKISHRPTWYARLSGNTPRHCE